MNEVAIIRRNLDENVAVAAAAHDAFPAIVNATRWEHIRIDRVDSRGQITVYVAGRPLDELRAVISLGLPHHGLPQPSRDEIYIQIEREQAFKAALATLKQVKIVNRGTTLAWNYGVFDSPGQLRILSKIGWRTPSVTQSFALGGDTINRLREPEPEPGQQELVAIGLRRHARLAQLATPPGLETLVGRTQLAMRELGLDFVTVPYARIGGELYAYGMAPALPNDLPKDELMMLLQEAIA